MAVLQEFQCPHCDGAIAFDSGSQKMKCPYCDAEFDVDTVVALQSDPATAKRDDMSWDQAAGGRVAFR